MKGRRSYGELWKESGEIQSIDTDTWRAVADSVSLRLSEYPGQL